LEFSFVSRIWQAKEAMMHLTRSIRITLSAAMCSFAAIAWACLWDSDTLRHEANGMPGVVEAVTGFFPAYPDAYYERRIEIARERLAENPDRLASYDDIAVSLDRLGDSAGAIEAIEPKLAVVERLGDAAGDHLYRYHANLGTFYAHSSVRAGADGTDMSDLELAREHITKAIEINPDAHFGREYVQLAVIEWLLDPEAGSEEKLWMYTYPTFLSQLLPEGEIGRYRFDVPEGLTEGLVGLILLGNAWESVDVISAIGILMQAEYHSSLAAICGLRLDELIEQGHISLHPVAEPYEGRVLGSGILMSSLVSKGEVRSYYTKARASAEKYRSRYKEFVTKQIEAGKHPDTHSDFFAKAPKAKIPRLPNGWFGFGGYRSYVAQGVTLIALLIFLVVANRIIKKRKLALAGVNDASSDSTQL